MSVEGWIRRLGKQGLALRVTEQNDGNWFAYVSRLDPKLDDRRLLPVGGIGIHLSRDEAIQRAVAFFHVRLEENRREQVVLALAAKPRRMAPREARP